MKTKSFLALLLMSALFLTSCKDNKGVQETIQNGPQDLLVSLDLGDNLRAAMANAQDVVKAGAAAMANVDVYLTTTSGTIMTAQRFVAGTTEFNKLISTAPIGTGGGYKFVNVDATVTRASVVVNPQGNTLTAGDDVNALQVSILAQANQAIYAEMNKPIEAMGVEPINPDPGTNANVKKVTFELKGDMSRFQVATVFSNIMFKDDAAKERFMTWKKQYVKDNPGAGRTYDAKDAAYVAAQKKAFGSYNDGRPTSGDTGNWTDIWKVTKVTDKNKGVFMNDFDYTLTLSSKAVSDRLLTTTYAGAYTTTDGSLTINTKNVTDFASYFNTNGFTTSFTSTGAKVLAFNFFAKQALGKDLKTKGVAPRLHFYFNGEGIDTDHQFVNLVGYDLGTDAFKEALLLNIDMSKINNGDGIIVISDDPAVPGNGKPDINNESFNLIVRVTIAPWTEVNVKPIAE